MRELHARDRCHERPATVGRDARGTDAARAAVNEPAIERDRRERHVVAMAFCVADEIAIAQVAIAEPVEVRIVKEEAGSQRRRGPSQRATDVAEEVQRAQGRGIGRPVGDRAAPRPGSSSAGAAVTTSHVGGRRRIQTGEPSVAANTWSPRRTQRRRRPSPDRASGTHAAAHRVAGRRSAASAARGSQPSPSGPAPVRRSSPGRARSAWARGGAVGGGSVQDDDSIEALGVEAIPATEAHRQGQLQCG